MADKKQVRINIDFDTALKIQVWANSKGMTLPQACSAICEAFSDDNDSIEKKLDCIIELLSKQNK